MQQIERYGVIALVFLLVTIVAVSFWGDSKSPGFWSRLTGRGAKKDANSAQASNMIPPATSTERAIDPSLPLTTAPGSAFDSYAGAPSSNYGGAPSSNYTGAPSSNYGGAPSSNYGGAPSSWQGEPAYGSAASPPPSSLTNDPWTSAPTAPPEIANRPESLPLSTPPPAPGPRTSPHSIAPAAGGPQYVVQKGDNLIRIASKTLGGGNRWTEIQALNGGLEPRNLRPGMTLALPASAKVPSSGSAPAAKPSKRSTSPTKPGSASPASGTGTYVVRAGDTLSSIASRMLGDGDRWREILAANPGLDPKRLFVGKSLRVPGRQAGPANRNVRAPVLAAAAPRSTSSDRSDRPRVR